MHLESAFHYTVKTEGPLEDVTGSADGDVQYWKVSEARLEGPHISASLAMPGSDWMRLGRDGFWRPDVRIAFIAHDDSTILLHYTGLVQQTETFKKAAETNHETTWADQYLRLQLHFTAGSEKYRWLEQSLFVARGRLLGTGRLEYEVFRVA